MIKIHRMLIILSLFLLSAQAFGKNNNDKYKQRKKEGVRQLDSLILHNRLNTQLNIPHKNWYIFSDKDPIEEIGYKFFFKNPNLLKELNKKIRKFNQENDFELYVKLNGFELIHIDSVMNIIINQVRPKGDTSIVRIDAGKVNEQVKQKYQKYYAQQSQITQSELEKTRKYETDLTYDIYNSSKLGRYGIILSVTGLYYYHNFEEKDKQGEMRVQYDKSIAFGTGFLENLTDSTLIEVLHDNVTELRSPVAIELERMKYVLEDNNTQNKLDDSYQYLFTKNPDKALSYYINLCMKFMKTHEIKRKGKKGKGYNVIYLLNITGNLLGHNKRQTKNKLIKITKRANEYFKELRVTTRVALYEGKAKDFKFEKLSKAESVVFFGGRDASDAEDMAKAIDKLAIAPSGQKKQEYDNNKFVAHDLRDVKSTIGLLIDISFINDDENPERSTSFSKDKMNRVVINYARARSQKVAGHFGLPPNGKETDVKISAWCIVHGAGHNAQLGSSRWHHYGGIMVSGNYLTTTGSFKRNRNFDFVLNGAPRDKQKYQYQGIWISSKQDSIVGRKNYKSVMHFKKVLNQSILTPQASLNDTEDRELIYTNFKFDQKFINSKSYTKVITSYPSLLPNHAYKYSMEKHFGKYKATVNPNINAKIYL